MVASPWPMATAVSEIVNITTHANVDSPAGAKLVEAVSNVSSRFSGSDTSFDAASMSEALKTLHRQTDVSHEIDALTSNNLAQASTKNNDTGRGR